MKSATTWGVHCTEPKEFIEDNLIKDLEANAVEDLIVRLAMVEAPATERMLGMAYPRRNDNLPWDWARAQYVEAAYLRRSNQIVKLSKCVGYVWGEMACDKRWSQHLSDQDLAARRMHNEETRQRLSKWARWLQSRLTALQVDIRAGTLNLEEGDWTAYPEEEIKSPPPERCRFCNEPIYHANNAWRHTATKRPEAMVEVGCDSCGGLGSVNVGSHYRQCSRCYGLKTRKVEDHVAEPAEVEEPEPVEVAING